MTDEELTSLQQDHPEVCDPKNAAMLKSFMAGTYTGEADRKKAMEEYLETLASYRTIAQAAGNEEVVSYIAAVEEKAFYSELYASSIWKEYGEQTDQLKK
jgi:FPC/CPF motif-containing protein YcgG